MFKPWIGSHYASPDNLFGKRILVLGESHYGPVGAEHPDTTVGVVRRFTQTNEQIPFFTKTAKLLLGLDQTHWLSNEQLREAFENVAFYNYITRFVGAEPRQRPTIEMWEESHQPFLQVLAEIQPNLVIILGKGLNSHVSELPDGIQRCFIQHPSTAFSYAKWGPVVTQAIRRPLPLARGGSLPKILELVMNSREGEVETDVVTIDFGPAEVNHPGFPGGPFS